MASRLGWRSLMVLLVIGGAVALISARPARLGLDLRGGTQIVLEAKDTARQRVDDDTVERTFEVLRRRVDQLGVAEPSLQRNDWRYEVPAEFGSDSSKKAPPLDRLMR